MKFSASTLAFFISAALAVAVPEAAPVGMVSRDVSGTLIGRSFPCASNDPTTCCAVRNLSPDYRRSSRFFKRQKLTRINSAVVVLEPASTDSAAATVATAR